MCKLHLYIYMLRHALRAFVKTKFDYTNERSECLHALTNERSECLHDFTSNRLSCHRIYLPHKIIVIHGGVALAHLLK